jgi:hypothetical protein
VTTSVSSEDPAWLTRVAKWLTPRRIRAHAVVLALCLWGVCAVDFATPGIFDRAGNIKFQDFLPLDVSARLITQHRAAEIYDQQMTAQMMTQIIAAKMANNGPSSVDRPNRVRLPNLYGPQVGLLFVPLSRFTFQTAAWIWVAICLPIFFGCIALVRNRCPALLPHLGLVALCALAFPPLFHFFVRGQLSVLPLACFTAAYLAFRVQSDWLAGLALGFLVFKPQFLVAIPLVLLLARAWRPLIALVFSAAAQLILATLYFGPAVMGSYFDMLLHTSRWIGAAELSLAPIQMHSLRSFWTLLIPWPNVALALYVISSCAVIAIAAALWKSARPLSLRFAALSLATVLVNPHLFVYDLLMLAPALLLLADWALQNAASSAWIKPLLYLAFMTPLLGPLSQYTHLQPSVPIFAALLWNISKTAP